jgi:hypothetical protein
MGVERHGGAALSAGVLDPSMDADGRSAAELAILLALAVRAAKSGRPARLAVSL